MNRAAWLRAGLLGAAVVFAGCATPPPHADMTGGKPPRAWDVPTIEDVAFRDALVQTLRASRLFHPVSTAPGGAYWFTAEIVSQQISGTFDNTITPLVRYELLEAGDGKPMWAGNNFSKQELSARDVFAGQERTRQLRAMAVRDNLRQLLGQLDRALGQRWCARGRRGSMPAGFTGLESIITEINLLDRVLWWVGIGASTTLDSAL